MHTSKLTHGASPDAGRVHHFDLCVVKPVFGQERPGFVNPDYAEQWDAVNELPCGHLLGRCNCGDLW